jgi:hypothetical protein
VYRTALRRTRTVLYTEITGIEHRHPRFSDHVHPRSRIGLLFGAKQISSYRIYIGKRFITVDSIVYNYNSSAARILKAMKKQGIQCPVTTKKTLFG